MKKLNDLAVKLQCTWYGWLIFATIISGIVAATVKYTQIQQVIVNDPIQTQSIYRIEKKVDKLLVLHGLNPESKEEKVPEMSIAGK